MNASGKISLAGFTYHVGATYAGEPVEVVVAGGLVDILHAGVVVATHAQRMRDDQADRLPRSPVARRARDSASTATRQLIETGRSEWLRIPQYKPETLPTIATGRRRGYLEVS